MHRHELSDAEWARIEPLLPAETGRRGRPADLPNRTFMNAIFYVAKTGVPWRDLPERFGPWHTIHNKFTRWNRKEVFLRILDEFRKGADHGSNMPTVPTRRPTRMRRVEKGGPKSVYWTLSRRSTTKIHAFVDSLGRPIHIHLTAGNIHDVSEAPTLIARRKGRASSPTRATTRMLSSTRSTATHEGRDTAEVESKRQAQVQSQALPDSALRRELLLQDRGGTGVWPPATRRPPRTS